MFLTVKIMQKLKALMLCAYTIDVLSRNIYIRTEILQLRLTFAAFVHICVDI